MYLKKNMTPIINVEIQYAQNTVSHLAVIKLLAEGQKRKNTSLAI